MYIVYKKQIKFNIFINIIYNKINLNKTQTKLFIIKWVCILTYKKITTFTFNWFYMFIISNENKITNQISNIYNLFFFKFHLNYYFMRNKLFAEQ